MKTKNRGTFLLLLALVSLPHRATAHDGDGGIDGAIEAHSVAAGNAIEAHQIVTGTVVELKAALYDVERWPDVFSDVHSTRQNPDGTWSVDFQRFGHPHDFRVLRTRAGVVLQLAARDHGEAQVEYALSPVDATHSRFTLRFMVPTPPQLTSEQMLAALQAKAAMDLADFSVHALNDVEMPL